MMRSLKNKGALKNAHPTTRRNKLSFFNLSFILLFFSP
ncbi:hypothetical protein hp2018_0986 [Helicobacter pylori 2018]|nr:hypothetical protein hp2017_0982 [Helicobacter pylori 2017]ADZ51699.1 hypothetical protein hp2018_0986 [Helicobacter pylori 2018]